MSGDNIVSFSLRAFGDDGGVAGDGGVSTWAAHVFDYNDEYGIILYVFSFETEMNCNMPD